MPQDEIKELNTNNRKMKDSNGVEGEKVRPQEPVTVYASRASKHLGKHGTPHSVHRVLADKLVANGEATLKAPAVAGDLTEEELIALENELGKKPNKGQIAAAVKAKADRIAEEEDEL